MSFAGYWDSSYLPSVNKTKRRISLFTGEEQKKINATRKMRGLPELSAMMAGELVLSRAEPLVPPSELVIDDVNLASSAIASPHLLLPLLLRRKRARKEPMTSRMSMMIARLCMREAIVRRVQSRQRRRERRRSDYLWRIASPVETVEPLPPCSI